MDILEASRLLRFTTDWERHFHDYDLLVTAGIDAEEAERIATLAAADRPDSQEGIAA